MRISDWSSDVCSSDLRPRFDMGDEHSAERPALRRVNNPSDVSDAYLDVMTDARTVDMIADLIGPNVKFHHCKINVKLPGARTEVAYHQDFAYTPHTSSEARRVGKECVSKCSSRVSPYH